jgi:hypothetical protein
VYLDLRLVVPIVQDPLALYREFVKLTFKHIAIQRPTAAPYVAALITYFTRLPQLDKIVPIPSAFAIDDEFRRATAVLSLVADRVWTDFSANPYSATFFERIFLFPRSVGLAFGFGGLHFAVDHLDDIDVDIVSTASPGFPVVEAVKLMLSVDSFAIACTDERHLLELLDATTDDVVDIRACTEIVSVVRSDSGHSDRYWYRLRMAGSDRVIAFRMDHCAGCPGYLSKWDVLMPMTERLQKEEKKDSAAPAARELRVALREKLEELVDLALVGQEAPLGKIATFDLVDTGAELDRE